MGAMVKRTCARATAAYLNETIDVARHRPMTALRASMHRIYSWFFVLAAVSLAACQQQAPQTPREGDSLFMTLGSRLPTGVRLDPAKPLAEVGPMALTMRLAPEGDRVVISLSG